MAKVTDDYRKTTMATLRVAFLSALVLELTAAVATALVAVEVGLRLLYGHLGYETALLVLLLTPEAFLPLRAVGAQFHASMEGAAGAGARVRDPGHRAAGWTGRPGRAERDCGHGDGGSAGRRAQARRNHGRRIQAGYGPALDGIGLQDIAPGERIVLTGPSGAGKSTLLALLLRFLAPAAGTIQAGGDDVAAMDLGAVASGRSPGCRSTRTCSTGSVADNIALGGPVPPRRHAGRPAGRGAAFIEALPRGYDTPLGERGLRLSSGQRQQIALARAFLRDAPLLLLDEPTAHLGSGRGPPDRPGHGDGAGRPHRHPDQPRAGPVRWQRRPGRQHGARETGSRARSPGGQGRRRWRTTLAGVTVGQR